jgi:hypothetical protein
MRVRVPSRIFYIFYIILRLFADDEISKESPLTKVLFLVFIDEVYRVKVIANLEFLLLL